MKENILNGQNRQTKKFEIALVKLINILTSKENKTTQRKHENKLKKLKIAKKLDVICC